MFSNIGLSTVSSQATAVIPVPGVSAHSFTSTVLAFRVTSWHKAVPLSWPLSRDRSQGNVEPILGQRFCGLVSSFPRVVFGLSSAIRWQAFRRSDGSDGGGGADSAPTLKQNPKPWPGGQSHWHEPTLSCGATPLYFGAACGPRSAT